MAFRTHVLNFEEFYARGDGVTDDTAYVNNVSANLSDAGGLALLPRRHLKVGYSQ